MAITKLTSAQLYRKCDASKFEFNSTADLEERLTTLGQDRAICAVELGINIKSRGYARRRMIGCMFTILMSRISRLH